MKIQLRLAVRRVATVSTIAAARARARALAIRFAGVQVSPQARVGKGTTVSVAPTGRLVLGDVVISSNVMIQVAPGAVMVLKGRYVGPNSVIVARQSVIVDAGAIIAEMCVIRDSDHVRGPDGSLTDEHVSAPVLIGEQAWLAAGVAVLKGVTVGARATVAAGAVVTRDVAAGVTVAGVPAREVTGA